MPKTQAVVPPPDGGYPGGNTAEGTNALLSLTTGQNNTAVGLNSLSSTTTGNFNTAIGSIALRFNTANYNTALGRNALFSNRFAEHNTAVGDIALYSNTAGDLNTAIGESALHRNTQGVDNTAVGDGALAVNPGASGSGKSGNRLYIKLRNCVALWFLLAERTKSNSWCVMEIIADNLSKVGWSLGWVSALDRERRTIWIVDAPATRENVSSCGADEKLTAFLELESAIRQDRG